MKRIIGMIGLAAGSAAGCVDMGLEGNRPLEEAEQRQTSELVAAVTAPVDADAPRLVVDGRLWLPSGLPLALTPSDVRAIGAADGRTVYARSWDASPYDALFLPAADGTGVQADGREQWIELRPVPGRTGAVPGQPESGGGAAAPGGGPGEHAGH